MIPFIGEIKLFAFDYVPQSGWIDCSGQELLIAEFETLASVIGTEFGGDGKTTFALPDYRNSTFTGMLYCIAFEGFPPNEINERPTSAGELAILPFTSPQSWIQCDGNLLQIADYKPLFQLLGKTFGGDGVNTFALPNLTQAPPPYVFEGAIWSIATAGNTLTGYPYLGEVRLFPSTQTPEGWQSCTGDILSTEANNNLFSLLGNKYGGDGIVDFALPNLTNAPIPAGTNYQIAIAGIYPEHQTAENLKRAAGSGTDAG